MSDLIGARLLIAELSERGIVVWADGERLRYKAPDGALTEQLRSRMIDEKQQLLELLAASNRTTSPQGLDPISRSPETAVRLSFSQERLWFLEELLPGNPTYNMPYAYRLRGALDVDALRSALSQLIARHEILRTELFSVDGVPGARTAPSRIIDLPITDLTGTPEAEREARALELAMEEARRPFDLRVAPLMRAVLIRLDSSDHLLILCLHHVVNDDWSLDVLWRELSVCYEASCNAVLPQLPEMPLRYSDFAAWQHGQSSAGRFDAQLEYWRSQLATPLPQLELHADFPRPARKTYQGDVRYFSIPDEISTSLRRVAQDCNATLFMVLAAAFKALLFRYTGQEDIVIGTAIAGRGQGETAGLVGFFINNLVLRTSVAGNPRFVDLVERVRDVALSAYENQDAPFERVIDALRPERDTSRTPFFDVLLVLHRPPELRRLKGLAIEERRLATGSAKFDLTLEMTEHADGGLSGVFEFDTDLYLPATIDRVASHLLVLLEAVVAAPTQRVSTLALLPADEHAQLAAWNATTRVYPQDARVHELVTTRAAQTPTRVAVTAGTTAWNYGDLEAASNRLARELQARGVGRGQRVGLCLERGAEMLAAVLGVLKTGAAYVPLDPGFPVERLRYMVEDAQVAALVATTALAAAFGVPRAQQVLLDADAAAIAAQADTALGIAGSPSDPAYVIYTSGSTGRPKGVVVPHGAVVNFLTSMATTPGLTAADVLVAVTTLSFDIAVLELLLPLVQGAQVVIAAREETLDGGRLQAVLAQAGATVLQGTPVTWRLLLEAGWRAPAGFTALVGGEALPKDLAEALLAEGVTLWNMYGPTETTVWSTCGRVETPAAGIRIGRPIANTTIEIVDGQGQLCPIGVPGEIYIGGAGVTHGYWQQPALTEARFVPDPARGDGARRYRTGDQGRWHADGTLEHLGRLDDQTKVRGFRIELGEIEAVLAEHATVQQAAVYVWEVKPGDVRLVACCLPAAGSALAPATLRAHLRTRLPDYMVPQHFVPVDRIPLTPNGKVDRRALPRPESRGTESGQYVAPRTATEEIVAGIWAQVLGVDPVSVEANFFGLGGHSLKAMQVMSRVRQTLGVEVPVRELFVAPTVARLAAYVDQARTAGTGASVAPPLRASGASTPAVLSFAQQRLWFLDQVEAASNAYVIPRALRMVGPVQVAAVSAALETVVARHEALRTTFAEVDGQPVAVVALPGPISIPVVAVADEAALQAALAAEVMRGFDLAAGPLYRAGLYTLGPTEAVLLVVVHHIISDAWSLDVMWREFGVVYTAAVDGVAPALPALPVQYRDFAQWQRAWLQGPALAEQLAYWREHLAGAPQVLDLPTDRPRPAVESHRGGTLGFQVAPTVVRQLHQLAQREGTTLFMVVKAAFDVLLWRYTGQTELLVGTPVSHRGQTELEGLIGLFVNTVVLRGDLRGDPTVAELLGRVREASLQAYAHQELPLEVLVEALQPARDLSRNPLFQVMLVVQAEPPAPPALSGVTLTPLEVDRAAAQLDLTLYLQEVAGGVAGVIEYATDLFEAATIARMAAQWTTLLEALSTAAPTQRVSTLALLPAAEQAQLAAWNATTRAYPQDARIHELIRAVAAQTPTRVAVTAGATRWNYGELEAAANRIARALQARGVGPGQRVGLCLERGAEMLAAVLGVLKTGAAYVPLDPGFPVERLRYMVEDAQVAGLVTTSALATPFAVPRAQQVWLDADTAAIAAQSGTALAEAGGGAADPAYVIYTSGSTGRPKGVVVPHGAVVNFLTSMAATPGLTAADVLVAVTTLSFDIAVLELLLPLVQGAQVVIAAREETLDGGRLAQVLAAQGATVLQGTPVTWRLLLEAGWRAPAGFRALVGGEALPKDLAEALLAEGVTLWNMYGPTETTVWSTCGRVETPATGIRIGRPIANTTIAIVDGQGQVCPIGVPGEIYIGGAGVTTGYWNQPTLTAERFVADPAAGAGARRYRTGDRGRWHADGTLEHLGRLDDQTKVRGFRIELGEIEAVLGEHADVQQAAVYVWEVKPGDVRLVACCVPAAGSALAPPTLRAHLRTRLPDYMVPQHFLSVDRIPLTPNGKVDRRALPRPEARGTEGGLYVAPRTATEEIVAGIWAQVLGVGPVSREANFFGLGGHSLKAMQVVSRVRQTLGVDVPVRELFIAPTVAGLSAAVERVRAAGAGASAAPPLRASAGPPWTGLSFAQQRLWFLDQVEPTSTAYVIPRAMTLTGPLRVEALAAALGALVARHEALRTTFGELDGQPVAQLQATGTFALPVVAVAEAELGAALQTELARGFALAQGPLCRAAVYQLEPERHVLLLVLHHIIADAWSLEVIWRELGPLYTAAVTGTAPALPALPVQYRDFAQWQRAWLQGPPLAEQLAYWREHLAGAPQVLDLPTDRPRPAMESHRGGTAGFAVAPGVVQQLHQVAQREGTTLFMVLKAAFDVLLWRYTGQAELLVGTPVTNRGQTELEGLIGLFVNTVVLRGDLRGDPTVAELLGRVRAACLQAYAHQELPLEVLVEALQPARDLSRNPLFQVMLVFQPEPAPPASLAGVTLTPLEVDRAAAQLDLTVYLQEVAGGLAGVIEYATDLFEAATIARLAAQWTTLLEAVSTAAPTQRVSTLTLLPAAEQAQLTAWNATAQTYPQDARVHELVAAQAAQTPTPVAVTAGATRWSYGELEAAANRIARALQTRGVGPGQRVGLCLERGAEMLAAVLGVLKTGAAYVPLDPGFPVERLRYMVEDAQVAALVATTALAAAFGVPRAQQVLLDADAAAIAAQADTALGIAGSPSDPAYVIYTSGSTGRPKGVVVPHGAVVNFLTSMAATPGLTAADVLVAVTTLSFDIAVLELLLPLVQGAQVVIAAREETLDGGRLAQVLAAQGATVLQGTPVTWRLLLEAGWRAPAGFTALVGGEALPKDLAEALLAEGVTLWNMYGPTETTVWSTCGRVETPAAGIRIGRPIANTTIEIVDGQGQLCPIGVPGEIYIGGAGVTTGYWNQPALTAERFVADPAAGAEARRYRTGDRGRWHADGTLEHLGRLDDQTKVRGFRIELGEIEAVLSEHAEVQQAAVYVWEVKPGDVRLVACCVPAAGSALAPTTLRQHLRTRLPDYMVPQHFVAVDRIPLTPNGKVDRRALPRPEARGTEGGLYVAPRTATEEIVAGIWAQVLGVDVVSIEANFFGLGGHSLKAMQVVSRVRQTLGVDVPVRELFVAPTVARLSAYVEQARGAAGPGTRVAPPLQASTEPGLAVLSFAQQRLWFLDQVEPTSTAYVIPRAMQLTGPVQVGALADALGALVARHEALRTTFGEADGAPLAQLQAPGTFALPVVVVDETALAAALQAELARGFDLARGPLYRAVLYRLEAERHVLLVVLHHIIADAWSLEVVWRELGPLYTAAVTGKAAQLPALPVQYRDFAQWQRAWLQGPALTAQLDYWRTHLAGAPQVLDLLTDRPRPAVESHRGGTLGFQVAPAVVRQLHQLAQREGTTLFMVVKAAFDVLLWRYTGQAEPLVGTPVTNRGQTELEGLIGLFVNTVVLRGDLRGDPTVAELLGRVRAACLQAYAHQELPLEVLVEALQPARDLSRNPLFQVMLVFQPEPAPPASLAGIALTPLDVDRAAAQLDLTVYVQEVAGGVSGLIEYATDLFDAETIARLAAQWTTLLDAVSTAAPTQRVSTLALLPAAEQAQLAAWNATTRAYPDAARVHELVAAQAAQTPTRAAVTAGATRWNYGELEAAANRIARALQTRGVGPGQRVGLCLERGAEMLAAVLGVLKTGAAYVPLDPGFPVERLRYMVEDAQVAGLVTTSALATPFAVPRAQQVWLDGDAAAIAAQSGTALAEAGGGAADPAYVIYTSGSTGRPKGVVVPHGAVVNFLTSMAATPGLTAADVLVAVTTLSFDIAVLELLLPLVQGAQVVIAAREETLDGGRLAQVLAAQGATVLQGTPVTWRLLLEAGWRAPAGFRALVGGEALPKDLAEALLAEGVTLWNMYGPTETTVWSTCGRVETPATGIRIGRPIANTTIAIVDGQGQVCPIGVPGEIYIGGAGVTTGYWNQPALTAERFVADPAAGAGARRYRTGDRGRWHADGTLEHLGRLDDQTKVRGFRIELGEIEAVLGEHADVQQAAVYVWEVKPGDVRLVACCVPAAGSALAPTTLRKHLRTRLPDYMVPQHFVAVERIPLTPNGKVDRRALPRPIVSGGTLQRHEEPADRLEIAIAEIWSQMINPSRPIGRSDKFFEMGGHSLVAMQVLRRIEKTIGVKLEFAAIFQESLADMANRCRVQLETQRL